MGHLVTHGKEADLSLSQWSQSSSSSLVHPDGDKTTVTWSQSAISQIELSQVGNYMQSFYDNKVN